MNPTAAGGGGGGSSSLDSPDIPSAKGGGGGGESASNSAISNSSSNNNLNSSETTSSSSGKYSSTTTDLRGLNLSDYDDIYTSFINKMLENLGVDPKELSLLEKLELLNANKSALENYIEEESLLPPGYNIDSLLLAFTSNYFTSLVPTTNDFNSEEVLNNYVDLTKDILSKLGISELDNMSVFELSNKLNENKEAANELFSNYGVELNNNYGISELINAPMMSIAYSLISTNKDMFIQYIDANDYSSDIKNQALESYEKGNVSSAIYILQLDDLNNEEINNAKKIEKMEQELSIDNLMDSTDGLWSKLTGAINIARDNGGFSYNALVAYDMVNQLRKQRDALRAQDVLYEEDQIILNNDK